MKYKIILLTFIFASCSKQPNCETKTTCTYTMYNFSVCQIGTEREKIVVDTIDLKYQMWDCETDGWLEKMRNAESPTDPYILEHDPELYELMKKYKSKCNCE